MFARVEITMKCAECGSDLDGEDRDLRSYGYTAGTIHVMPCEACIERAKDAEYSRGYDEGKAFAEEGSS